MAEHAKKDVIAQLTFDARPLLLRFHLWLEDITVQWERGGTDRDYERFDSSSPTSGAASPERR